MSFSVREPSPEIEVRGLGISSGIAIGTTVRIDERGRKARLLQIDSTQITRETRRLHRAVNICRRQLNALKVRMERELGREHAYILDAQMLMLQDAVLFKSIEATICEQLVNAEWAIKIELDRFLSAYASISDGYLRQRGSDIEDIAHRLINALTGKKEESVRHLHSGSIIIAEDLPPSVLAELDMDHVIGLATCAGGWASHTAIIARSLSIPALVGINQPMEPFTSGRRAIVDGGEGIIIIDPTDATLHHYRTLSDRRRRSFHQLVQQSRGPAITQDGLEITLRANVELLIELQAVKRFGAQGIGLFRSEFIFTNMLPQAGLEEGQFQIYNQLAEASLPHGVSVRTFDLSEDKLPFPVTESESNPSLGLRGIRLALQNQEMFRTQVRAIVRASRYRNMRILLPLISCVSELRRARKVINEVTQELLAQGVDIDPHIPVGVMIEVPAAAMMIEQLAQEADFLSLGTNDLIQYMLAVDRSNKQVAYLYQPLHPAVLRVIAQMAKVVSRFNKPLDVCGEMAANPVYAAVLIGLGITRLSMTPASLPLVKDAIRTIDVQAITGLVQEAMEFTTAREIEEFFCNQLADRYPVFYANLKWRSPKER